MKKYSKYFLFLLIAVLLPFIIANEIIRWTWYRNYWYNQIMVRDTSLIFALRPGFSGRPPFSMSGLPPWKGKNATWEVKINSQGIRSPGPVLPKSAQVFRIICLGDSLTFGLDVDDQYTYPSQLENFLRRVLPGRGVEVINGGVVAYSSRQGLVYLDQKLLKLQPDLLILGFGYNDAQNTFITAFRPDKLLIPGDVKSGFKKIYSSPYNTACLLAVHQPLAAVLRGAAGKMQMFRFMLALKKLKANRGQPPKGVQAKNSGPERFKNSRVPPEDFRQNLKQFVWLAQHNHCKLMFYIPYRMEDVYRDVVLELGREYQIPLIDCSRELEQYRLDDLLKNPVYGGLLSNYRKMLGDDYLRENSLYAVTSDAIHPNEVGNRIIAEKMAEVLLSTYLREPGPEVTPGAPAVRP